MKAIVPDPPVGVRPAIEASGTDIGLTLLRRGQRMRVVRAGVRLRLPIRSVIYAAIVGGLGTGQAYAAQPTLVIANAPIVTPSAALTYYGTPTSPTPPTTRDPLIQEQARALRYDVDKIFAYVRDNVETIPMFGVQEGARGIVLNGRGTDFDQAQFMVEALREADAVAGTGYSPQYILGTVTLNETTMSSWLNVTTGAQASRVLAAGGIPATVTGTGTSYTVTMLHPWVKVTISGTQYLFDPGLKTYAPRAGTSWQPALSYSQATLLAAGGGGTGTTISNFNQSAFRTQLDTYRANVEAHLASNGVGKRADAIIGTRDIVAHPSSEDRRTTLPYVVSSDRTWTGQIPDKFRASFIVSLKVGNTTTAYNTYFADQVGGKTIGFGYTYSTSSNSFSPILGGQSNPAPTLLGSTTNGCDYYLNNQANAAATASAVIAIDHPYAASSGTYGDRTLTKQLVSKACVGPNYGGNFYVTNDWGYTGTGVSDRVKIQAARQRNEPVNKFTMIFAPTLASVARQYSQFLDTASWAQGNTYLLHDLIGVHTLDNVSQAMTNSPNCCTIANSLTMDFEGAVSALSASASTTDDTAAAFTAGFGLPLIEGSVPRQEQDAVYDMASLSLLTQQSTRAGDAAAPLYLATNTSTWNSVKSTNNLAASYPAAALTAIGNYVSEGYSVLVPKHGDLIEPHITVASVVTRTMSLLEDQYVGGELKRSAFFAWHPGTGGVPDKVAMLVYDPRRGRVLKAGVGVAIDSVEGTIRKPEAPKAESKDIIRAAINVDGKTGHLKYSPAPDLVDGVGEFPFSLSLQRAYDQTDPENYGFGIGWKHNWYQFATSSNDGSSALGGSGAQALGPALVLITVLGDLTKTVDAQHLHAAAQAATWFTDQTIDNSVVIASGLDGERTYYRQQNGTFASGSGDGTKLVQSGTPVAGIINRRLYHPVSFTLTDRDGSTRRYPTQTPVTGTDLSSPGMASVFSKKSLPMDRWSFPNGVVVNTSYFTTIAAADVTGLDSVTNNLGASISWPINSPYDYGQKGTFSQCELIGGTWTPVEYTPRPAKITFATSAGATMTVDMDAQVKQTNTPNNPPYSCSQGPNGGQLTDVEQVPVTTTQTQWTSYANDVVDANGKVWKYGKALTYGLYGTYYTLNAIYKPSQPNTPDVALDYGDWANQHGDYNVRTLTDIAGNVWNYHTNPFRSEIISPLQNQATPKLGDVTKYDRYGQAVASIDALGRQTTTVYDALGRVIQKIRPAGDSEVTTYDARGNTLSSSKRPVGGNGSTDLTSTYNYVVGPTVVTCTMPEATCNKLLTETPPRGLGISGFTTDYAWNSDGTLLNVTKPADPAGNRPMTTLSYSTGLNGTDGTPLKLLIGKTERISSALSTTTTYTRDAANKFTVSAATVDQGGLNLRTCVKFDGAGNLISISDPRQVTCP